jgi:hypothetical protein
MRLRSLTSEMNKARRIHFPADLVISRWLVKAICELLTRGKKRGKFFPASLNPAIFLASGCGATVAHQLPKLRVAGSNPVARSKFH